MNHVPKIIAFYLPQFHPIRENDAWWGRGFTEWTNVARAKPLFRGHDQPRIPADLGFYDLRLAETREAQADLARQYGVSGFCYYHYWINGRRLLERPFDEVLASGRPDFPFCLCWANETWSRRWLGEERDVLIEQTYSAEDDEAHARWLVRAFSDRRYIRVGGRPLFLIYRPAHLPEPGRILAVLRAACAAAGVATPYIVGTDAHARGTDFRAHGFDGTLNLTPQLSLLPGAFGERFSRRRLMRNLGRGVASGSLKIYDYRDAWRAMRDARPAFPHIPAAFVGWDNSPRRGRNGIIICNSTPDAFADALRDVLGARSPTQPEQSLVFVNAWNEWGEGNYLEPDRRHGRAFLEALRAVLDEAAPREHAQARGASPSYLDGASDGLARGGAVKSQT